MKRLGILVGLVGIGLLVAGISYEVTHQAEPVTKHAAVPVFEVSYARAPKTPEYGNFSDNVSLWDAPRMPVEAANASFGNPIFPGNLASGKYKRLESPLNPRAEPVLTVLDEELAYSLFASGSFKLTFNLKPVFDNPQVFFIPTRVDPGIGGSFNF